MAARDLRCLSLVLHLVEVWFAFRWTSQRDSPYQTRTCFSLRFVERRGAVSGSFRAAALLGEQGFGVPRTRFQEAAQVGGSVVPAGLQNEGWR